MFEWRCGVGDETQSQHSSTTRRCFVARSPVAPGAMRCSAREPVEAVRPRITYRRPLDFVGDDRAAGRVVLPAALSFNHLRLATLSGPKGGVIC
jgi:hypothetical protein